LPRLTGLVTEASLSVSLMKPSADQRHAARQERSKSIIDAFEAWLAQSHAGVSAKSPTGEVSD
jgi:hypothetical protein